MIDYWPHKCTAPPLTEVVAVGSRRAACTSVSCITACEFDHVNVVNDMLA